LGADKVDLITSFFKFRVGASHLSEMIAGLLAGVSELRVIGDDHQYGLAHEKSPLFVVPKEEAEALTSHWSRFFRRPEGPPSAQFRGLRLTRLGVVKKKQGDN